jgi:hypothetical protein
MNIYNNIQKTKQDLYDTYNNLIFSDDSRIFNKMTKRIELFIKTKEIVGDIWEIGVFKGSGVALWAKLKKMYDYNSPTKIVGVDFFEPNMLLKDLSGNNKEKMADVLNRVSSDELTLENISKKLSPINNKDLILLKGEAYNVCENYQKNNQGLKIKILYMDIDLGEPTYNVLKCLWKNVSLNGIVVFDEYAYHCWDESVGVDKFLKEIPNQYKSYSTKVNSPSMYIVKTVF